MEFERINCKLQQNSQDKLLEKMYKSDIGKQLLKVLTGKAVSELGGRFMDSPLSVPIIKPFIEKNNIDMSQYEEKEYKSYNDFFTRLKMARESLTLHRSFCVLHVTVNLRFII